MKRKILPGIILALALGSVGVWALITNTGSFPKFNRYYHLDDYLDDLEAALSRSIPFSDNLSSLAIDLKMKGGAREFDNILSGMISWWKISVIRMRRKPSKIFRHSLGFRRTAVSQPTSC